MGSVKRATAKRAPTAYERLHDELTREYEQLAQEYHVGFCVRRHCYASLVFAIVRSRDDADEAYETDALDAVAYLKVTSALEALLRKVVKTADEDALVKAFRSRSKGRG
jgi:hypothetical protein